MTSLFLLVALLTPAPMELPWGVQLQEDYRVFKDYQYIYGDVIWGQIRFLGQLEDIRSELLLLFSNRYLYEATLILGPSGITTENCIQRYKFFKELLIKKYGQTYSKTIRTDPLIDDLFYTTKCHAIKSGLEEIFIIWNLKEFKIELLMFGDDELYIEITYTYKFQSNKALIQKKKAIMKAL